METTGYFIVTDQGDVRVGESCAPLLNALATRIHKLHEKWWIDLKTGERVDRNVGELLMLVTSELAEAMEGHRRKRKDDHLLERDQFETEIMDAFIRLFDMVGGLGLDFQTMFEKMAYNAIRADHKVENRLADGGKSY